MADVIFTDPRYREFVERYHADPRRFALEVTGFTPSADQDSLFDAITPSDAKVSVVSGTGCFAAGTLMMRASGDAVAVEDIRVNDRLMGPDGDSVRNVCELRRGREPMYRFTYMDGSSHVFNESHILTLAPGAKYAERGKTDVVNVTVRDWLQWPKTRRERYYAYRSPVVRFEREAQPLPVPPYILGAWLGDGSTGKPQITTGDDVLDAAFSAWAEGLGCTVSRAPNSQNSWTVTASRVNGTQQANPASNALRAAGVFRNKNIPTAYMRASLDDRRELLAGLIDTDGHYDRGGNGFDFIQKCERMARDVVWLARSIGCHATVRSVKKTCGNNGVEGSYWRVTIGRNVELIPVRLERKKPVAGPRQRSHLLFGIRTVEPLGEGEYFGFVLDGDHRFLGYDFTVLHNTGKTATFARIALWHLLAHPIATYDGKIEIGSNTYIGAPKLKQVADGVWKELNDARLAIANGPFAWLNDYFTIGKTTVYVNGYDSQWFISQIALEKGKAVGVAGKHRFWQLIIIDEASGVSDDHFDVIDGTQTQGGNRTLLASQGARNAGRFYETHHNLSKDNGGSWNSLRFSSERSPFVALKWLQDRLIECGGRAAIEYKIRVRGLFAENSSNTLLTRSELEDAFEPRRIIEDEEPFGLVILADVAAGEYRDDSVAIVAKIIGDGDFGPEARRVEYIQVPICANDKNEIDLAGDLASIFGKLSNATLYVDSGGIGGTVCKLLERSSVPVVRINWGNPCFKKEYKDRYYNMRACAMVRFRDAVRQGRVVLPQGIDRRLREKILLQGARLPYHFAEAGGLRYVMMSKEDMRKEGIKSPDLIDSMSFAFLENCHYIPSDGKALHTDERTKAVNSLQELMDAALADLEEPA